MAISAFCIVAAIAPIGGMASAMAWEAFIVATMKLRKAGFPW